MHVLVDAAILKPGLGGIATYAEGITRALARLPGVRVTVATSRPERFADLEDVAVVALPPAVQGFGRRLVWRERRLRAIAASVGADVLLATTIELPVRGAGVPSLVVVHDIGPLCAPELYGRARRLRFKALLGPVLRRATRIACVSEATRAELVAAYPRLERPVGVVREGPRVAGLLPWAPADPPYVLYVGPLLPHKNVATLVRALGDPALGGVALRIAGTAGASELELLRDAATASGATVDHLGFVDDAALARLYAGARAVALPSLHEGFGLPLLEALGAGVPVVASAIAAHREIAGDAAVFVAEPRDAAAWSAALAATLADAEGAPARAQAARDRAAHYTWPAAAGDVHRELEQLVAEPQP